MSRKRPWHTELSSLVVTLCDDKLLAAQTMDAIALHTAITLEKPVDKYLPLAIEAADARPIHQWLDSLPGVQYVDVIFCSTETPAEESPVSSPELSPNLLHS